MIKLLSVLFAAGKLGPLLLSGGTMLLSLAVYAVIFGWRYAAGIIVLLFVHEMGHYIAARQRGLPVGLPTFIPFLGAWIEMKQMPGDHDLVAVRRRGQEVHQHELPRAGQRPVQGRLRAGAAGPGG